MAGVMDCTLTVGARILWFTEMSHGIYLGVVQLVWDKELVLT
jgi:hypothetical protein